MTKDLGWHDNVEHSSGIMTVVLAKDTQAVEGVATESAAIGIQTMCAMLMSLTIGFFFSW